MLCELGCRQLVEPCAENRRQAGPDVIGRNAPVEDPGTRLLLGERLGQQVVQLQHLDTALPHFQHEVVVVLLGFLHPEDVVEQQIRAVARRQPLMRKPGPADEHGPERSDFAVNSTFLHGCLRSSTLFPAFIAPSRFARFPAFR